MFRPYTGHHKPEKEFKQTHVTLARVLKMQLVQIQDRIQLHFKIIKKMFSNWTYKAVIWNQICIRTSTERPSIRWNECILVAFDYDV